VPVTVKLPDATPVIVTVQLPPDNVQPASTVPTVVPDEDRLTEPDGILAGFVVSATVTVQEPEEPTDNEAVQDTEVAVSSNEALLTSIAAEFPVLPL
jgi:hypothetical protein